MKKDRILFLLLVFILSAGSSFAQEPIRSCGSDQEHLKFKKMHPEVAVYEEQLEKDIAAFIGKRGVDGFARTTSIDTDTVYYNIPVVVHVIHNYGAEDISDNSIYALIAEMNRVYSLNYDTSAIVPEFKKYVGKAYFRFHLATRDPNFNPTKGITRHFSYLTNGGDNEAKLDDWAPQSYLNIWFEHVVGEQVPNGIIVAYTIFPTDAPLEPFWDGIVGNYQFVNDTLDNCSYNLGRHNAGSFDHEVGHFFGLYHTFGTTNNPGTNFSGNCSSDDLVDDTPPTDGCLGCCLLNDTICSSNYYKIYPSSVAGVDSLVDYPDTANEQNIMNYADTKINFTKGQVVRMRGTATSSVANRSNLWSPSNLYFTGILADTVNDSFAATPDLLPITDFAVKYGSGSLSTGTNTYFTCPGTTLSFYNRSWQDTIISTEWQFSGNAQKPTVTQDSTYINYADSNNSEGIRNSFSIPGWVSLTMSATGNNTGTTTTTYPRALFVADTVGTPADGYFMEFNNADTAKWPTFNYYNNEFKWQLANVGYYDNSCIQYTGYDNRVIITPTSISYPYTGTPAGDFDDLFSTPMDLSGFADSSQCNLNFFYSGASRSAGSYNVTDTLQIEYSIDRTNSWKLLANLSQESLDNKGPLSIPYEPLWQGDWAPGSIPVPVAARTSYVIFRFRYRPGVTTTSTDFYGNFFSSGNNFYMDRINFSSQPASVSNVIVNNMDVVLAPNPTTGDAYVIIKDNSYNTTAQIVVSDITGKVIYTVSQPLNAGKAQVEIPHTAISVKGVYMVQTTTGGQVHTQKLVVD